jgi:hypothetical protein
MICGFLWIFVDFVDFVDFCGFFLDFCGFFLDLDHHRNLLERIF